MTLLNDIKQENVSGEEASSPVQSDHESLIIPQFHKLYDSGEFGNSFLTKYTQLLNSFHQQQQQQQQHLHQQSGQQVQQQIEEDAGAGFTSLIPTTVQEQQISPPPKDAKSLTCHLCGATIKHIANFRRHMKQHLNPRRFPCPWCSAAFGRKDNLKTHTRKHHPAEVEVQEQGISASLTMNEGESGGVDSQPGRDEEQMDEDGGQVFNGIDGETSPPINEETEDSGDQNGEDDSLIIADEGDEEAGRESEVEEDGGEGEEEEDEDERGMDGERDEDEEEENDEEIERS